MYKCLHEEVLVGSADGVTNVGGALLHSLREQVHHALLEELKVKVGTLHQVRLAARTSPARDNTNLVLCGFLNIDWKMKEIGTYGAVDSQILTGYFLFIYLFLRVFVLIFGLWFEL